jgi:hypothetical protein
MNTRSRRRGRPFQGIPETRERLHQFVQLSFLGELVMRTVRFSVFSVLCITLMATAILVISSTNAQAQSVWDLQSDFSLTGSPAATESDGIGPNGAWSFHIDNGGEEVLFNATGESKFSGGDLLPPDQQWTSTLGDPNNLWVAKAEIPGIQAASGEESPTGFDLLAGEINMAPLTGPKNKHVILRWTAPSNMQINVEGIVWGAHTGQTRSTSFDITHSDSSGTPYGGTVGNVVATTPYVGNDTRELGNPFGGFTDPTNHPTIMESDSSAIELSVNAGDRIDLKNYAQGPDGTISGVEFTINEIGGSIPTSFEWTADTVGVWSDSSNWTPVIGPPATASHTAVFGNSTSGPTTTVLTSDVTVNSIEFDSSNSYAISGLFEVSLDVDPDDPNDPDDPFGDAPSISVSGGNHEFQATVNLLNDTTVDIAAGSTLSFNNVLNLNGHNLDKTGDGTLLINNGLNSGGGTISALEGVIAGIGTVGGDLTNSSGIVSPGSASLSAGGSAGASIPEPSTLVLFLTLGALSALGRPGTRKRK